MLKENLREERSMQVNALRGPSLSLLGHLSRWLLPESQSGVPCPILNPPTTSPPPYTHTHTNFNPGNVRGSLWLGRTSQDSSWLGVGKVAWAEPRRQTTHDASCRYSGNNAVRTQGDVPSLGRTNSSPQRPARTRSQNVNQTRIFPSRH